jgi:hypothetical protein
MYHLVQATEWGSPVRIRIEATVAAPVERVYGAYADYPAWPRTFPTIRAVRPVGWRGDAVVLAIDHVRGPVTNELLLRPPDRILLRENKRAYDATFDNRFSPCRAGTRWRIDSDVRLRGAWRLLAPVARVLAPILVRRLQVRPVRAVVGSGA